MTLFIRQLVWFFCAALLPLAAQAQPLRYSLDKSFLLNAPEALTVNELPQQAFLPYQYDLHLGFQDKPVWLRFDIKPLGQTPTLQDPGLAADSQMILRLAPYQLDTAEVYEPKGGEWLVQKAGDRVDMPQRICPDDTHCLALSSPPDQPVTLFVKVFQRGVFSVRAEVLPFKELSKAVSTGSSRNSASIAIAGSLLFMALVLLMMDRNMLLFTFSCFQAVVVVFILCTTGRLQLLMPDVPATFFDNSTHHLFSLRVLMFCMCLTKGPVSQYRLSPGGKCRWLSLPTTRWAASKNQAGFVFLLLTRACAPASCRSTRPWEMPVSGISTSLAKTRCSHPLARPRR